MLLWTSPVWKGHIPVCPVSFECEECASARKALTEQVRVPPHEAVWLARRPVAT
jgi:hypothetical protein